MSEAEPPSNAAEARGDAAAASAQLDSLAFDRRATAGALGRLVWLVPIGLAIDIFLSLWVSHRHVEHSVIVQVEPLWRPGERLAVRGQMLDAGRKGIEKTKVELAVVDAEGKRYPLGELRDVGALNQGAFDVPAELALGQAQLEAKFSAQLPSGEGVQHDERVTVGVVEDRPAHEPVHTINASVLQWADDTSDNPQGLRIEVQPFGRLLAGFDNQLLARVTDAKGVPSVRRLRIRLVSGEFGGKQGPGAAAVDAKQDEAPLLVDTLSDELGLVQLHGQLDSDVIRLDIEVLDPPGSPAPPATEPKRGGPDSENPQRSDGADGPEPRSRRFRLVSFSGGVRLLSEQHRVAPGGEVALEGESLQPKRPIYVDVHGPDGAWIDTLMPPLRAFAPPRPWPVPTSMAEGMLHFEGYAYTNAPGQSAEVLRVWNDASAEARGAPEQLAGLLAAQRKRLDLPREKTGFDPKVEAAFLDALEAKVRAPDAAEGLLASASLWLMGSLPVEVFGPPLAVATRGRQEAELAAWKARWTRGLRIFLWGGGGLAILFATFMLFRQQRQMLASTREVLGDAGASMRLAAGGDLLTRGLVVIVILASALALTSALLENLVWTF